MDSTGLGVGLRVGTPFTGDSNQLTVCVRYSELQNKAKQVFASKLNLAGSASPCISSGVNSKAQSLIIEAHTGVKPPAHWVPLYASRSLGGSVLS